LEHWTPPPNKASAAKVGGQGKTDVLELLAPLLGIDNTAQNEL
jgi:hypothetical protein